MPMRPGTKLRDTNTARLVDALLEGPQSKDVLMARAGMASSVVFYNALANLGAVQRFKTTVRDRVTVLFWLVDRPAYRQPKVSDVLEEAQQLRDAGREWKQIARDLGLKVGGEAVRSAVYRERTKPTSGAGDVGF